MSAITNEATQHMAAALDHVRHEFARVRTGRASAALLDHIHVEYYGTPTPLNQIAAINVPEARMMTITPYDAGSLREIERALQQSDLGITPSNDGTLIRLVFPELTGERRKELAKHVRQLAEEGRVSVRNARRHANDELKKQKKDGDISEDEMHAAEKQIQKLTDDYVAKVDDLLEKKEAEIAGD